MQFSNLGRREFITLLGGAAAAWPLATRAQQAKVFRIGFIGLSAAADKAGVARIGAFRAGLRSLGYVEGRNIIIEDRWAEGKYDRLQELAAQLVRQNVDVIVAHGTPATRAAKQATTAIPIVMVGVGDAVTSGVVASISRPDGNVTGSTFFSPEIVAKRLELIKEAVPALTEAGILLNSANPAYNESIFPVLKETAQALKLELLQFAARGPAEFEAAFTAMAAKRVGAIVLFDDGMLAANVEPLAKLALQHQLPSVGMVDFAAAGGLIYYGVNFPDLFRRAATYVDKFVKGAKPGELPVERPTKFDTILNLKTAKALGLEVPTSILLRADEVIE
jgi:putative tryptophan/tyrosine transport system substrate-binding protein